MQNKYPKIIRTISIVPGEEEPHQSPCTSPLGNSSLLNTMIQLKQGNTPKHNKTFSQFSFKNNLQNQTQPTQPHKLHFEPRQLSSHSKYNQKRTTPCFVMQNQNTSKIDHGRQNNRRGICHTENSESELALSSHIQQSLVLSATERTQQLTFRNMGRKSSIKENSMVEKQNTSEFRSQSPPTSHMIKQASSIQFMNAKSPKNQNKNVKKQMNVFDQMAKTRQLERQVDQLNENIVFLNKERQENFRLISQLNSEIMMLRQEGQVKQIEFQTKQGVFFEEINQLIKDRKMLETKLSSLQATTQQTLNTSSTLSSPSPPTNSQKLLQNILVKLNQKDAKIKELEIINSQNQMKLDLLCFQVENLKSRAAVLNPSAFGSQHVIFEQAYRHLEKQIEKYKQKLVFKDQEIKKVKEKLLVVLEQKQDLGSELEAVRGQGKGSMTDESRDRRLLGESEVMLSPSFANIEMSMILQIFQK